MKTPTSSAGSDGFTLLEVLLALVLLGLVATLVLPNVADWRDAWRLREAAYQVRLRLGEARLTAVEQGREVEVLLIQRPPALLVDGMPRDLAADLTALSLTRAGGGPGVGRGLTFYPDGSADAGVLRLTVGRREVLLALDPVNGRATVASP